MIIEGSVVVKVLCFYMTSSAMFVKVEERPEWGREGGKYQ